MDYIEYLNIRLEQIKNNKQRPNSENISNTDDILIFEESNTADKNNEISEINSDYKLDINNLNYEDIISGKDNSLISFALKDLISFEQIKKDIDKDNDGEITSEELKKYIQKLAKGDGDATNLSIEDFNLLFKEKNIDLEEQFKTTKQISQDTFTEGNLKPLEEMSLSELSDERVRQERDLAEKQNRINTIFDGTDLKVKKANGKANAYKKALLQDIQEDDYISSSDKNLFTIVLNNISKKDKELRTNSIQISNNETKLNQIDTKIEGVNQNIAALNSSISTIEQDIGVLQKKLGNRKRLNAKQKQHYTKKLEFKKSRLAECNKTLALKESELADLKTEQTKLQEEQQRFESNKSFLEQQKSEFNKQKQELEDKIKSECSITTKLKINLYEKALKKADDVKSQELTQAKQELIDSLDAANAITSQTVTFLDNKFKSLASDLNIEDIPIADRNRCSGGQIQTLNDGTEVLTFGYTRVEQMQPEMVAKIAGFQRIADEEGLIFVISDGSRTVTESNNSRARKGSIVAPGGLSPHNYGAAIDIALYRNGKMVSAEEVIKFAQRVKSELGVKWGGDFEKNGEFETHHYELINWRTKYKNENNLICQYTK